MLCWRVFTVAPTVGLGLAVPAEIIIPLAMTFGALSSAVAASWAAIARKRSVRNRHAHARLFTKVRRSGDREENMIEGVMSELIAVGIAVLATALALASGPA